MEGLMQTLKNNIPGKGGSPGLVPGKETSAFLSLTARQLYDLKASLRLVLGSALLGGDAYLDRLRSMQAAQESARPETIQVGEDETFQDQLKYLLLGIMFETPEILQRGLLAAENVSSRTYRLFSRFLSPVANSWMLRPVKKRVDRAAARGESVIDRLVLQGRIEEQNSRLLLQQKAIDDLVNDVMEYVILKTEVMQIVEEAGVDVAGGVLDDFREQSSAVDLTLESKLRSIFRKPMPAQEATPPGTPNEER
jgi:hypothetical protein